MSNKSMKRLLSIYLISSCFVTYSQNIIVPAYFQQYADKYPDNVIIQGNTEVKSIALTFDDGPSEVTVDILDLLEMNQVKATFFWQGANIIQHPEIVKRAISEGHLLANHSWDHPNGLQMSVDSLWMTQIAPTNKVFDSLFALEINYFRPPFGAITEEQLRFLADQQITTVLWSLSTLDWDTKINSSQEIVQRFEKELHPGAIVLMHDVDFENTAAQKLIALRQIIAHGTSKGFRFTTIDKLNDEI